MEIILRKSCPSTFMFIFKVLFVVFMAAIMNVVFMAYLTRATDDYSLSFTTNVQTVEKTIEAMPDVRMNVLGQDLNISTNNPSGARLFVSSRDEKIVPTDPANSDPVSSFHPTTGTVTTPTVLSPNTFGFAVVNVGGVVNAFSDANLYTDGSESAVFSALKDSGNPVEVANTKQHGANFKIYYGASVNSIIKDGDYAVDVLYTVISNTASNTLQELDMKDVDLKPRRFAVRESDGSFYRDPTININTNIKSNMVVSAADVVVTVNNKICTDVVIKQNFTTDFQNNLQISCKAPTNPASKIGTKYDVNIKINKYDVNITKQQSLSYIIPEKMQAFNSQMCAAMAEHDEKFVVDIRDDELYTMAKLKDKKCWMTENLRLKLATDKVLTSVDSDVKDNWTPARATDTESCAAGTRWNADAEGGKTVRSCYESEASYNTNGVYYTYSAATVNSADEPLAGGQTAKYSICPRGWRLPKTKESVLEDEFYKMAKNYIGDRIWDTDRNSWGNGQDNLSSEPQKFGYSGRRWFDAGGVSGNIGAWWTSKAISDLYANNLALTSVGVYPRAMNSRSNGYSVRCVQEDSAVYMQDFTMGMCDNLDLHDTKTLIDARDNEKYTVAKLKDGKCWMTQSLRLQLKTNKPLTVTDSDVSTDWTPTRDTETSLDGVWNADGEGENTVRSYIDLTKQDNGVYYTQNAATAGTLAKTSVSGETALDSVCPKGWRLPRSNPAPEADSSDTYLLVKNYTSDNNKGTGIINEIESIVFHGGNSFLDNAIPGVGFHGARNGDAEAMNGYGTKAYFWTANAFIYNINNSTLGFNFAMLSSNNYIKPNNTGKRINGQQIRCIKKEPDLTMQEFTVEMCKNMKTHEVLTLRDSRDNERYTVVKLRDNKCWMTQNLRLKLDPAVTLTPENTNVAENWTPGPHDKTKVSTENNVNIWSNAKREKIKSVYNVDTYDTAGVYYDWNAATANSAPNESVKDKNATSSICPKGWRLPVSSSNVGKGEFWRLLDKYKGTANWLSGSTKLEGNNKDELFKNAVSFVKSGKYVISFMKFKQLDANGFYIWSSTMYEAERSRYMYGNVNGWYPHSEAINYSNMFSVRCVAGAYDESENENSSEPPKPVENAIQAFNNTECDKMPPHDTKVLTDARDGEKYTVAKLRTGKCWMTQNLRLKLDKNKTLTPQDTDISTNWTPLNSTEVLNGDYDGPNWEQEWSEQNKPDRSLYQPANYNKNGVYYNYISATAGTGRAISADANAPGSICPKGWRLPHGGEKGEMYELANAYRGDSKYDAPIGTMLRESFNGANEMMSGAPKFVSSGSYVGTKLNYKEGKSDAHGRYWTATKQTSWKAYTLFVSETKIQPAERGQVSLLVEGQTVRCLLR